MVHGSQIRFAVGPEMPLKKLLKGVVEADENLLGARASAARKLSAVRRQSLHWLNAAANAKRGLSAMSPRELGQALHD